MMWDKTLAVLALLSVFFGIVIAPFAIAAAVIIIINEIAKIWI